MTGYFNYYAAERIQLMGITETSFAKRMSHDELMMVARKMMRPETPAFVVSTGLELPQEFMDVAAETHIPVLATRVNIFKNFVKYDLFLEW